MDNIVNSINPEESLTCSPGIVNPGDGNVLNVSLTDLNGLDGTMPYDTAKGSVYGAEFMPVEMHTPYYRSMLTATVDVPWLAEPEEASYLNRTKEMNEPHVQTYKELKLNPVNQNTRELIEDFGLNGLGRMNYVLFLKIILIIVLFCWIYKLTRQ
jgi:hypothetical protein